MALLRSIFGHWVTSVAGAGLGGVVLAHGHDPFHVVVALLVTLLGFGSADGTKLPPPPPSK